MKRSLLLLLCTALLLLTGCGLNVGKPIEVGEGDGATWAPTSDGKFVVVDVENRFSADIEFVCSGRPGIFRLMVQPGQRRFMVLRDVKYTTDLRTRKEHAGLAEYLEKEERILGVRRLHYRVITKGDNPNY